MAIQIVCAWCGSDNVTRDAWARWDDTTQAWVLCAVFDDGFCHRCETWRGLEERAADSPLIVALSATIQG